jgi:hypothetical protein
LSALEAGHWTSRWQAHASFGEDLHHQKKPAVAVDSIANVVNFVQGRPTNVVSRRRLNATASRCGKTIGETSNDRQASLPITRPGSVFPGGWSNQRVVPHEQNDRHADVRESLAVGIAERAARVLAQTNLTYASHFDWFERGDRDEHGIKSETNRRGVAFALTVTTEV